MAPVSVASSGSACHSVAADNDVPVEVLVEHLLAAKRSLSSMTLVLRANDIETSARRMHEESAVLAAQAAFLGRGVAEQMRVLRRVRRGMGRAYEAGRRDFKHLIRTLDAANSELEQTMAVLRDTAVDAGLRPTGEAQKCLMDFVHEKTVDGMRDALKESIAELQAAQTSFDGDMLRFDNDLRALANIMASARCPSSTWPSASSTGHHHQTMADLLAALTGHSHAMAEHLTSLNNHFDMCVTAVRTTEGGAALARRRAAAEGTADGEDAVSISGVIGREPASAAADVLSPAERAEVVAVVVQDAPEVGEVVAELEAELARMETLFGLLASRAARVRRRFAAAVAAFRALEDIGLRLPGYAAAEAEYAARRDAERDAVAARLAEMDGLRRFYDGYAGAYDGLLLEVARRRAVEAKVAATWRKARDAVEKLLDADRRERDVFRHEIGEFLPTDLWVGMDDPLQRWQVVPVEGEGGEREGGEREGGEGHEAGEGPAADPANSSKQPVTK